MFEGFAGVAGEDIQAGPTENSVPGFATPFRDLC